MSLSTRLVFFNEDFNLLECIYPKCNPMMAAKLPINFNFNVDWCGRKNDRKATNQTKELNVRTCKRISSYLHHHHHQNCSRHKQNKNKNLLAHHQTRQGWDPGNRKYLMMEHCCHDWETYIHLQVDNSSGPSLGFLLPSWLGSCRCRCSTAGAILVRTWWKNISLKIFHQCKNICSARLTDKS